MSSRSSTGGRSSFIGRRVRLVLGALGMSVLGALVLSGCSAGGGSVAGRSVTPTVPVATTPTFAPTLSVTSAPAAPTPAGSATTTRGVPVVSGVTITRTGGLAGVMQVVAIAPDGTWTYTDKRAGDTQQGKLTTAQREDIAGIVANPSLSAEARVAAPGSCADGFVYTISAGEASMRFDQCAAAGKRPLTERLLAVVQDATPL